MIKKIKDFIFLSSLKKKRVIPVLLFFLILELFTPFFFAHAIIGVFGGIADAIGKAISAAIAAFLTAIPAAIFGLCALILQWSIDPAFIRVPAYTSGAIVDIGWPIVRDLANMGIVLALVIIGLATALRLEEYQARRTLPRLIIVALLINFTPVILGFIVDATNIVMYFFLDGLMGIESVTTIFAAIHSVVASDLMSVNFFAPLAMMSFMFKIMIIWLFYILTAIIFLLFAVLFIARRIAIWMLVIFSPLAFLAWVLPNTRRLWTMWWNQFIQWSIIGVFAAFFLYLGDHIIGMAASGGFVGDAPGGFGGWIVRPVVSVLEQTMPFMIAMIFLLVGFFVALTTSAFGAGGIIRTAQKGTKWAGKAVGAAGVSTARAVPAVSRAESAVRRRLESTPMISGIVGGPGTYAAELERDRKRVGRNLEQMPVADLNQLIQRRPVNRDERLRRAHAIALLAERNRLGTQHQPYAQEAINWGVSPRLLYGKMPNWAPTAADRREHVERQEPREFRRNIQSQAFESRDANNNPYYTPENLEVFYAMDMTKAQELGRTGSRQQKEALSNLTDQMEPQVTAHIAALHAAGQHTEADRIENMWIHVQGSPNYTT